MNKWWLVDSPLTNAAPNGCVDRCRVALLNAKIVLHGLHAFNTTRNLGGFI